MKSIPLKAWEVKAIDEEVIVMLADAVEFWVKRCEKLEKQRGELISALDTIRKMAEDERGYIPEDETEDFLTDLWCKARNPVLKVRGEVE